MTKGKLLINVCIFIGCSCLLSSNLSAQTLKWALEETVRSNPDIQITAKDRLALDETVKEARAGYFPKVDITAGAGEERSRNLNTVVNGSQKYFNMPPTDETVVLDQMLFDGFGTYSEVQRSKARVQSAAYKVVGTAQDTALRTVEVYITVLLQQHFVEISRNNLAYENNILDMIRKRTDTGLGRRADLVQAEARVALAQTNVNADEGNLIDAESRFIRTVGKIPHDLLDPMPPANGHFPRCEREAVQWAIMNHPTLKSAKADLDASFAQNESAKAPMYPHFDLILKSTRSHDVAGVRGVNNSDSAIVRMNYNLFAGGKDISRIRETAYLKQEAGEVLHKTLRQTVENIQLSWNSLQTARRQLVPLKAHRDDSQETVVAYRKQFQLGQRTLLDLLDSENEYYTASRNYTEGQYNELFAQFRVLNGIGCLLQSLCIPFPGEARPLWYS